MHMLGKKLWFKFNVNKLVFLRCSSKSKDVKYALVTELLVANIVSQNKNKLLCPLSHL